MFKNRLTVTVPEPCHEDWNAMTRQDKGRFCNSCQKMVMDFTAMTDAEVVRWLTKQKGNTCGRFTEKQLARELVATKASAQSWTWRAMVLGLSAWLSAKSTETQILPNGELIQQHPNNTKTASQSTPPSGVTVLKGIVLDSAILEPMPGVAIQLSGTSIAHSTNGNGEFEIAIPDSLFTERATLTIVFIGYLKETLSLKDLSRTTRNKIILRLDPTPVKETIVVAGGAIVVKCHKWYSPQGLYYRARNLFH